MTIPIVDYSADENAGSNIVDMRNKLNQLRLFPGQLQGQQLENQLRGLNVTNQRITNETAHGNLQGQYMGRLAGVIAQATAGLTDPAKIQAAGTDAIARGAAAGLYPQDFAAKALGGGNGGIDWTAVTRQAVLGAGNAAEQKAAVGDVVQTNTGGNIVSQVVKAGPEGASVTPAAGAGARLPATLTPSEATSPAYTGVDDQGRPTVTLKGDLAAGGPPRVTGPPAGVVQGMTDAAQQSSAMLTQARQEVGQSGANGAILKEISSLLDDTNTGPGTQTTNGWRSFLIAQAPILQRLGIISNADVLTTARSDELKKYLVRFAAQQASPRTNEGLATFASGNANPDMSNLANRDVTRMNLALLRYKQAEIAAYDRLHPNDPSQFGHFDTQWNTSVDPRGFMLDLLSPEEQAKALARVAKADEKKIGRGLLEAERAGIFRREDIQR